jgi:hypothetical protein
MFGGSENLHGKPSCPVQNPHDLTWDRTHAVPLGSSPLPLLTCIDNGVIMYYAVLNGCILFARRDLDLCRKRKERPRFLYFSYHKFFIFFYVLDHVIRLSAGEFCSLLVVLFARNVKTPSSFLPTT